jgi:hypothetical protein
MSSIAGFEGIVGQSPALREVLQQVEMVAGTDSTVLLLGETGTGKELIARAIHDRSHRGGRTFVNLNCVAIPTGLLESEMFGHERGAFTGAISQKIGRVELADQGSLFLDEIGDIPLELQPKTSPCAPGARVRAPGQHTHEEGQRASHSRHASQLAAYDPGQTVSQRSLLPAECFPNLNSSVARTSGRHSAVGAAFCPALREEDEQDHRRDLGRNHGGADSISVAGQHPRAAESDRTSGGDLSKGEPLDQEELALARLFPGRSGNAAGVSRACLGRSRDHRRGLGGNPRPSVWANGGGSQARHSTFDVGIANPVDAYQQIQLQDRVADKRSYQSARFANSRFRGEIAN